MMEKKGPSITVSPMSRSRSFTLHRMISHSSYLMGKGRKSPPSPASTSPSTWFTEA